MSNFESSSSELVAGANGGSEGANQHNNMSSRGVIPGIGGGAPRDDATPLSAEETQAVMNEQPMGAVPSAEEMEDRKDVESSVDNLLPTEKLENGLKHVRGGINEGIHVLTHFTCCTRQRGIFTDCCINTH